MDYFPILTLVVVLSTYFILRLACSFVFQDQMKYLAFQILLFAACACLASKLVFKFEFPNPMELISIPALILALSSYLVYVNIFGQYYFAARGRAVFISGCDTGLGHRLAIYFDSLGCEVFAGCLNPGPSRQTLPDSVTVVPLDVCSDRSVRNAVSLVENKLKKEKKRLWALINNAGVCVYGEFEWQTWNQVQRQVEVNLLGTMRTTKAFIPLLRESRGRIVTVTSVNGSIAYPGLSVYSATKFALEGLCHALRLELLRQHGIRVIIVEPGDLAKLTSIMSQHERNAEEMWNAMPQEDQEQYGEYFRRYHRTTMKNYGLTSPQSFEESPILEDMKDAILGLVPRIRYISARVQYRLFYKLLALLPFAFIDWLLDNVFDMLLKSDD